MIKKLLTLLVIAVTFASLVTGNYVSADSPPVLITEVQAGFIDGAGTEYPKQEFIELANVSPSKINVTNWKIEYLSAANNGSGAPTSVLATLDGQINLNGHVLLSHMGYNPASPDVVFGQNDTSSSGMLAKSGGHVRLINGNTMVDCVAWGSAVVIAGCDKVSAAAPAGYSLQRPLINGFYDKTRGVANFTPPNPQGGELWPVFNDPPNPVNQPGTDDSGSGSVPMCDNVQLSEILANPTGDDAQGEFIELYNPTSQTQSLYGCSLRLANGKQYDFSTDAALAPQEYKAFPYSTTGLQLANGGGTVALITSTQEVNATYPTVGDDEAWAFVADVWGVTERATPNAANSLVQSSKAAVSAVVATVSVQIEPCPAGKYRNPSTGRCRNIISAAPQAICAVGQERNPATGRCRRVVVTATPTPCQPDQTRNPDTGRCRKNEASTVQKPCDAGQERNPDTGRCRKQTNQSGRVLSDTTTKPTKVHALLVVVILTAVVGYAVYEYRHDIISKVRGFKNRRAKP